MNMNSMVADWHGEQACVYYTKWSRTNDEADLRDYCRHVQLAERMWKALRARK